MTPKSVGVIGLALIGLTAASPMVVGPAKAQNLKPSVVSPDTSLEQALADISPTDWSAQSSSQLVQRVLSRATRADLDTAAASGDPRAETILAMARSFGLGGYAEDKVEAVRLYGAAAARAFAPAQEYLAWHYEEGDGVAVDISAAIRLHRSAADQGYARAQTNLGVRYLQGSLVAQDYPEAMRLFRSAADNGNLHGMRNVGFMYERGFGVPADMSQAIYWYRRAGQLGFEPAHADLKRLGVGSSWE